MNHSLQSDEELVALLERTMYAVADQSPDWQVVEQRTGARWVATAAASVLAVVVVGALGLVVSSRIHDADHLAESVGPSPSAARIDAYPIVNWPSDPIAAARADYGRITEDQGWVGTVGIPHLNAAPTSIIVVAARPAGTDPFPDAGPGRVAGVRELTVRHGNTTLIWTADGVRLVASGDDIDLMYQLVNVVAPITATPQRGGYRFTGRLPGGLVELEAPYHVIPMTSPSVATDDGTFVVSVEEGPVLATLAGAGDTKLEATTANRLHGFRSTLGDATIGLAVSSDETLFLSSKYLTPEQLLDIANHIEISNEAMWRSHYGLPRIATPTGAEPTTTSISRLR